MSVFDLTEIQAQYILDTPLRRLTRYDRLELEREREKLQAEIAELTAILESEARLRALVSDELADVAKQFADPRRTVLLEGSGKPARAAAVPLEVADDPCLVLLSSAGLLARTAAAAPGEGGAAAADGAGPRSHHDVIVSSVPTTARGSVGLVTSRGRLIRIGRAGDAGPAAQRALPRAGRRRPADRVRLAGRGRDGGGAGRTGRDRSRAGPRHRGGRGQAGRARTTRHNATEFEVISLKDGDRVVGAAQLASEDADLVFITSDAQLLRFPAGAVRPQGRAAGGMAGIRLSARASVVWFGAVPDTAADDSVVVTVAGSSGALPGTAAASVKVTPYQEYPAKGRATGGVRCQRFLKGEDSLVLAWAGPAPARGATEAGVPVYLPPADGRRDGSGERARQQLAAVGGVAPL